MLEIFNLANTFLLIGLIWIIQIVHYPSFRFFDKKSFLPFHHFHTKSITKIVAPTMLLELGLGAFLAYQNLFSINFVVPFLMVLGIWASTMFLQIPLHAKLADRLHEKDVEKLISSNWIRTILWTLKGAWLIWIF